MFYYSLAETLGYASVDLMLNELESYEISEWLEYYKIKNAEQEKAQKQAEAESRARRH